MAGSKKDRQEEQVILAEQRRERVASLYVRGVTQARIAEKEGVSQKTISLDLKRIRQQWAKNAEREVGAKVLEEIARIDAIEEESWEAWRESKKNAEAKSQEVEEALRSEKGPDGERTGGSTLIPVSRKLKVSSKGQVGDPRFLDRIAWCVEVRLKLLDAFPREKKALVEAGDGAKVVVFIEDMHSQGRRPSDDIEARLALEAGGVTVDQPPPPQPPPSPQGEPGRNGSH